MQQYFQFVTSKKMCELCALCIGKTKLLTRPNRNEDPIQINKLEMNLLVEGFYWKVCVPLGGTENGRSDIRLRSSLRLWWQTLKRIGSSKLVHIIHSLKAAHTWRAWPSNWSLFKQIMFVTLTTTRAHSACSSSFRLPYNIFFVNKHENARNCLVSTFLKASKLVVS